MRKVKFSMLAIAAILWSCNDESDHVLVEPEQELISKSEIDKTIIDVLKESNEFKWEDA